MKLTDKEIVQGAKLHYKGYYWLSVSTNCRRSGEYKISKKRYEKALKSINKQNEAR